MRNVKVLELFNAALKSESNDEARSLIDKSFDVFLNHVIPDAGLTIEDIGVKDIVKMANSVFILILSELGCDARSYEIRNSIECDQDDTTEYLLKRFSDGIISLESMNEIGVDQLSFCTFMGFILFTEPLMEYLKGEGFTMNENSSFKLIEEKLKEDKDIDLLRDTTDRLKSIILKSGYLDNDAVLNELEREVTLSILGVQGASK